ncbi:MAG: hypothetical protein ABL308_08025 [Oceanicaulis sp.]
MIRAVLTALALAACSGAAFADSARVIDLAGRIAGEAETRADAFRTAPAAPAEAPATGDRLLADLTDFALAARALSAEIEARGGPEDLKCIFRGMSRDAGARIEALDAAETRADMSRAYAEIARLARQAEQIAADPEASGPAMSCSSD